MFGKPDQSSVVVVWPWRGAAGDLGAGQEAHGLEGRVLPVFVLVHDVALGFEFWWGDCRLFVGRECAGKHALPLDLNHCVVLLVARGPLL